MSKPVKYVLRSLVWGIVALMVTAISVRAAEEIHFTFGPVGLSLRVDSLETFAKDGTINKDLEFYLKRVDADKQAKFREVLDRSVDLDPVLLSRFFNTAVGEKILEKFGNTVNIQGGGNGKYAIRGAIIQAAFDPQGLSVLNVLRKFPTNIQFDLQQMRSVAQATRQTREKNELMNQTLDSLSTAQASTESSVNFATLPDIRQPGTSDVVVKSLTLNDISRQREFKVDLYQPKQGRSDTTPVVVISHGLASSPQDYRQQAEHLASYGYLVAVPQHPGSDRAQIQNLMGGYRREVFEINEFVDRPQDISYVLDELEKRNASEYGGRLDLDSVGVMGYSFGGYTALALAGATLDFDYLQQQCDRPVWSLDLSLLLQCQALALPEQAYNFRDERVKAVFAVNPADSAIFGTQGLSQIKIPVFIGTGSYTLATPVAYEQGGAFLELAVPDKYLALVQNPAEEDLSELDAGIGKILDSVTNIAFPGQDVLQNDGLPLQLAFFEVHLLNNTDYRPYLTSSYAEYLSQQNGTNLSLINATSVDGLAQAIE